MSSGFISENEIAEKRRMRQEEWEKVRKPDQPLEVPEEEYDHRSLFDRLQEQKQRKEFEFEEAHRLKNMIKGLDDDEIEFLDLVDRSKLEEERKKSLEEAREMADFRNKVASLQEQSLEQRIQLEIKGKPPPPSANSGRTSQMKLLAGAVVKKRPAESQDASPKRQKTELDSEKKSTSEIGDSCVKDETSKRSRCESEGRSRMKVNNPGIHLSSRRASRKAKVAVEPPLRCIGILPGLTSYEASSDSCSDSDSDLEINKAKFDLLGRKICKKSETVSASQ